MSYLRGSLQNRLMEGGLYNTDLLAKVGTPATITGYTDRHPATVVKIEEKKNYRLIYVQEDDYIAKHKDIHAESQKWEYKRNPNGRISMFKEQLVDFTEEKKTYQHTFRNRKTNREFSVILKSREDFDYSVKGYKTHEDFMKEWLWVESGFKRVGTSVRNVKRLKYTSVVKNIKTNRLVKGCDGVIIGRREKYYDISF